MRAVPVEGLWKPRRVLIRVDFPAPLGPRSPMVRPDREQVRPLRMSLLPKRTPSPSSSITGVIFSEYRLASASPLHVQEFGGSQMYRGLVRRTSPQTKPRSDWVPRKP